METKKIEVEIPLFVYERFREQADKVGVSVEASIYAHAYAGFLAFEQDSDLAMRMLFKCSLEVLAHTFTE